MIDSKTAKSSRGDVSVALQQSKDRKNVSSGSFIEVHVFVFTSEDFFRIEVHGLSELALLGYDLRFWEEYRQFYAAVAGEYPLARLALESSIRLGNLKPQPNDRPNPTHDKATPVSQYALSRQAGLPRGGSPKPLN